MRNPSVGSLFVNSGGSAMSRGVLQGVLYRGRRELCSFGGAKNGSPTTSEGGTCSSNGQGWPWGGASGWLVPVLCRNFFIHRILALGLGDSPSFPSMINALTNAMEFSADRATEAELLVERSSGGGSGILLHGIRKQLCLGFLWVFGSPY
ncbi:hypothetical protein L7F22_031355 [Adiantum nelumboides]|nr:hypothetical protein [Adiantum nelumboides]